MYRRIYRNMRILCLLTLTLTAVLIVSVTYSVFENRIKDEIRTEADMLAWMFNQNPDLKTFSKDVLKKDEEGRITIIDKSREVIFDSYDGGGKRDNHAEREEVREAFLDGEGEAKRFSDTLKTQVFYRAVKLENGDILRISRVTQNNILLLLQLSWPIIFMLVLLYILCVIIAMRLTDNIIKPFSVINFNDEVAECEYEELKPFLNRIQRQREEIKRQMERVERQKSRLQAISENMSEGLVVLDRNENVLSVNKGALDVFGAVEDEVLNRHFIYFCRDISVRKLLKRTFGGEKESMEYSDAEKHYQIFSSPVYESGQVSGAVILIFDISERYETEQIRREFSANVSHELKTPITTILGYSQIINKGIAKQEDIIGFTEKIEKETSRLIKLIDDIIKLSRLDDEENGNIEKQEVHLKSIAEDCFERLSENAKERGVSLKLLGGDSVIMGNNVQIAEMVYNLCENALKYNKDGGCVTVSIEPYKISVKDTGIGIPKEFKERVFERFFRVDKSRSKSVNGTGLGLSIVKHIAKCHNAKITLESEFGKGTEITVTFPKED